MSRAIQKIYEKKGLKPPVCHKGRKHHSAAFHNIVAGIKASGKSHGVNPYAVAMSKLGKKKAYR